MDELTDYISDETEPGTTEHDMTESSKRRQIGAAT